MKNHDPYPNQSSDMLEPLSRGKMPISLYISQWLLVGVCTLALPQSVVRGISYKNTKALHNAMIIGTVVIGAMTLIATWIGVLSKGVLTDTLQAYGGSVDNITPLTIIGTMDPFWAGITIIGPIAATISTVSSLLLASSSAIIKDVYMHECSKRHKTVSNNTIRLFSMGATVILGLGVLLYCHCPAQRYLENKYVRFRRPGNSILLGPDLRAVLEKANRTGAVFAMAGGVLAYCTTMALQIKFFDLHQIVIGIGASLIFFLIGNALAKNTTNIFCVFSFPKVSRLKML